RRDQVRAARGDAQGNEGDRIRVRVVAGDDRPGWPRDFDEGPGRFEDVARPGIGPRSLRGFSRGVADGINDVSLNEMTMLQVRRVLVFHVRCNKFMNRSCGKLAERGNHTSKGCPAVYARYGVGTGG